MIKNILAISQIVLAILLMVAILLQQKGSGLGASFGGTGGIATVRRGADKVLFQATIALAILFFGISLAIVLL